MPEENTWYAFTKENISALKDDNIGIYVIGDINKVPVYIGSSTSARTSIKGRLLSHLRNKRCPKGKYFLCTLARVTSPHVIVHCIVRFSRFCKRIVMGLNRPMIYAA